jgi:protein-L-isoaspartate(D-aspartate) O-methyltransferase
LAEDDFQRRRARLVETLGAQGIADAAVLRAFGEVPRHRFVDEALQARAYGDGALPIGLGQTLSQPLLVARMIEALRLQAGERVLEVGTGSGYQAALLRRLTDAVFTVERLDGLCLRARRNWESAGAGPISIRCGDGSLGWPEHAPYDAIVVAAATPRVPQALLDQLRPGGRLVVPVGGAFEQSLRHLVRSADGAVVREGEACRFVRLIGEQGFRE